jgi:hypothetical protein
LRDLALVRRLSEQGIRLDAESALTRSYHPLRGALFSMIMGQTATYVWRADEGDASGFVQLRIADELNARLICVAVHVPSENNGDLQAQNESAWLALLDDVVRAVGRRGLHSLTAEVNESGPELPILRRSGFAVYTRQDIWVLQDGYPRQDSAAELQERRSIDDWDLEWLYANTIPPLIQLVEPSPPENGTIWLLREEGELTAFVHVNQGSAATWMQIFIHPNAYAHAEDILQAAVQVSGAGGANPIYCCVRRYQSWLQGALEKSGFILCDSQAVMVKHLSKPVTKKVGALDRILNTRSVRANTLLQRSEQAPEQKVKLFHEDGV